MNNKLINFWSEKLIEFSESLITNSEPKINILLQLDSLTSHWNKDFSTVNQAESVKIHKRMIPKGTTSFAQPLDKYFNHEFKFFVKNSVKELYSMKLI